MSNNLKVASDLLKLAKSIMAVDFPTQEAMDKYLKDHPDADRSNHRVVKSNPHPAPRKQQKPTERDGLLKIHPETKNLDEGSFSKVGEIHGFATSHAWNLLTGGMDSSELKENARKSIKFLTDKGHGDVAKSVAKRAWNNVVRTLKEHDAKETDPYKKQMKQGIKIANPFD